jgi:glyoxylase-like metal-dependent hydrolase (beta-lactamase superfamily II)
VIVRALRTAGDGANGWLVGDEASGGAIGIDPGCPAETFLALLSSTGLSLRAIVNTHGHFDHVAGNRAVREATGAPVLMHRADARLACAASRVAALVSRRAEDSPAPDRYLEEGDEVPCGDASLHVLHTPGHTPGGISLAAPGVLFCGDLVVDGRPGRTRLPGFSGSDLEASIRRILAFPAGTSVHPGHGPSFTVRELRERLRGEFPGDAEPDGRPGSGRRHFPGAGGTIGGL